MDPIHMKIVMLFIMETPLSIDVSFFLLFTIIDKIISTIGAGMLIRKFYFTIREM